MEKAVKLKIVFIGALLFPLLSSAGIDTFECTVTSVQAISESGEVISDTDHLKNQVGSTFSVDRSSGEIRGGYFINNKNSKSIAVTNEPKSNAFYVVSTSHGPNVLLSYLYVGNNREANQKPFMYTSSGQYIYMGHCI